MEQNQSIVYCSETVSKNETCNQPPLEALEYPLQVSLICLYSMTAALSLGTNILTIVVLLKGQRCAKDMRKFLINLSISDIGMAVFSIPFTYTLYMFGRWIFYPFMCPIVNFAQMCLVIVSTYTLAAIGVDRYLAIVYPFKSTMSCFRSHRSLIVVIIWLIGASIGSSQLVVSKSSAFEYNGQEYYDCKELWPLGSWSGRVYTLVVFILTFIVPIIVLSGVYTSLGFTLLRHNLPGEVGRLHNTFNSKKMKVVKMLVTIVILFIICWLPIQVFGLLVWFNPAILVIDSKLGYYTFIGTYFFCHWISMAHSFMNPIIYSFMSENFRADLKMLLCSVWHQITSAIIADGDTSNYFSWRATNQANLRTQTSNRLKHPDKDPISSIKTVTTTYV